MRIATLAVVTLLTFFSAAILISPATAWSLRATTPREVVKAVTTFGTVAAVTAGVAVSSVQAVDFDGSYADPNHPGCPRLVAVEGKDAILTGADGNPGCVGGNGTPFRLLGKVQDDSIFVDFAPKGGPKDLLGKWEPSPKPGIRWPDGNKWTLLGRPE